ncbi:MAG: PadR family transcriptional regulator [Phycisphaerales bacterium]|nr:PadR family transcriptional regulator [Phycisphaerales bacterium]
MPWSWELPVTFDRELLRGSLELMVLGELQSGARYGYQILTSLSSRSCGRVNIKAGTLYPILHKLEQESCVRTWWDEQGGRDRKWYALTEAGEARLRRNATEWFDYAATVQMLLAPLLDSLSIARPVVADSGQPPARLPQVDAQALRPPNSRDF